MQEPFLGNYWGRYWPSPSLLNVPCFVQRPYLRCRGSQTSPARFFIKAPCFVKHDFYNFLGSRFCLPLPAYCILPYPWSTFCEIRGSLISSFLSLHKTLPLFEWRTISTESGGLHFLFWPFCISIYSNSAYFRLSPILIIKIQMTLC